MSLNQFNQMSGDLNPSQGYVNPLVGMPHVGDQLSGDVKKIEQNSNSETISDSSAYGSRNINSVHALQNSHKENGPTLGRREQKADEKIQEVVPSFYPPIEDDAKDYDESEFNKAIKSEMDNLEILLKELYEGSHSENILSDQKYNEPYLITFFEKYPKSKTDVLSILLAGLYLTLGDTESAKTNLTRIRNPDLTDDDNENAGYHRAYYIMQANLEAEAKNFHNARELLKKCWDIPQRLFSDGQDDLCDFYATSLGKISLKEGNLKEAEKGFKDALTIRKQRSSNPRLISSSYNDLALLYIQKRNGIVSSKADSEQAFQYLNKAIEYDRIFQEELKNNTYKTKILTGSVDFKRPDIKKTEKAYEHLSKSE